MIDKEYQNILNTNKKYQNYQTFWTNKTPRSKIGLVIKKLFKT